MLPQVFLFSAFGLSALAQTTDSSSSGPLLPGPVSTPEGLEFEDAAGRQPNASNQVTFSRTFNNTPEEWSWRVNVTEYAVPDRITDLGRDSANYSRGYHVTTTQWQLTWPGDLDNVQSFLAARNITLSMTAMIVTNTSNLVGTNVNNGSCAGFLGTQCAQDLMQAASGSRQASSITVPDTCDDALAVGSGSPGAGVGFDISPNYNYTNDAEFAPNGTLFYSTSPLYTMDNGTRLSTYKGALQVLVLNFVQDGNGPLGDTSGPSVVCQVVDASVTSSSSSNTSSNTSSAANWQTSLGMIFGVALFSTFWIST